MVQHLRVMNLRLFLASVLMTQWCVIVMGCSWCTESQIVCLKREHENHGMMWRDGLAKYAQQYADEANGKRSLFTGETAARIRVEVADKPLRVCYSRLYVNFIETCSLYMLQRMDKILDFKDKGARFGCAISTRNKRWVSVCCLYKDPNMLQLELDNEMKLDNKL